MKRNIIINNGKNAITGAESRDLNQRSLKDYGLLKKSFFNFNFNKDLDTGVVVSVIDGVVSIKGLRNAKLGELLKFQSLSRGKIIKGMALNLNLGSVDAVLFDEERYILPGDIVEGSSKVISVLRGKNLLGRIVNALGEAVDGKGPIIGEEEVPIEIKAPGVVAREPIRESMLTGIKAVDSLLPLGRGQRELIIGDRKVGKTSIALDTILNQKEENKKNPSRAMHCIYVSIGQKRSSVKQFAKVLERYDALNYSIIVAASASEAAPLQFLAPFTACAIAEYFRDNAMHALIVYDDLSKQAIAFRQMSLLLRRPPGREAYPGDVFYLHSRLLERAANLNSGGSLTALPIIETQESDVSAYIATNVISITDGQIFLDATLFMDGIKPAISAGLSVSRVGAAAQCLAMRKLAGPLKLELAQYREVLGFQKFGSDLDSATMAILKRGELLVSVLNQDRNSPVLIQDQILYLFSARAGYLNDIDPKDVPDFLKRLSIFTKNSVLFSVHSSSLENNDYFKKYKFKFLNFFLNYFKKIVLKNTNNSKL